MVTAEQGWTLERLNELIGESESLRLEFKRSDVLKPSTGDDKKQLAKAISAFANTEGGVIVIGMKEENETATELDDGIEVKKYTLRRVEDIIRATVRPALGTLRFSNPIWRDEMRQRYYLVVEVGYEGDAIQASDDRFYRRENAGCVPMQYHDIRLRMFQPKRFSADLKLKYNGLEDTLKNISELGRLGKSPRLIELIESREVWNEPITVRTFQFELFLRNTSYVNIQECSYSIYFASTTNDNLLSVITSGDRRDGRKSVLTGARAAMAYGGMIDPVQGVPPLIKEEDFNLYPDDEKLIEHFSIRDVASELERGELRMSWRLYLKDSSPIFGECDVYDLIANPALKPKRFRW